MEQAPGRAERKRLESRERIVEAAWRLFVERGSRGVSMDEIAESADLARRTLFNYFPSKDDLLFAAASPVLDEGIGLVEAALEGETEGLRTIVEICLSLWRNWGRRLELLFAVELDESPSLAVLHGRYIEGIGRLIQRCVAADGGFSGRERLIGKLIYRSFVPLLLALEGEPDAEARFARGLLGLLEGAAGSGSPEDRISEAAKPDRAAGT